MPVRSFVRTTPISRATATAFSERRLRAPNEPDSLGSVAITLKNLDGGLGRSTEGNRSTKFAVSFNSGSDLRRSQWPSQIGRKRPCCLARRIDPHLSSEPTVIIGFSSASPAPGISKMERVWR
jgi:hypothetical protein